MDPEDDERPGVIIVTGAAGGTGSAVCTLLEDRGWGVVATDLTAPSRPCEMTMCLEHDVRSSSSWAVTVRAVLDRHGRVDGLVNVAGIVRRGMVWETSDSDWMT